MLIEILRNFGRVLDKNDGTGGVSPSSIAVAGPPPPPPPPPADGDDTRVQLADVMKALLKLQGDVNAMSKIVTRLAR